MFDTGAMAGIAAQSFFKVRMSFEIGNLLLMACHAKLMRLLPEQRQSQKE
jgi:hypothetical protein